MFRGAEPKFYVLEKADDSDYSDYTAAAKEDRIDYQFENDSQMVGKWESVDFVKEIDQFKPDSKNCLDDLYLTGLELLKNGEIIISATDGYFKTKEVSWTKGIIINKTNKTSSKCTIKEIDGNTYMYFEWKSGDYMYRGDETTLLCSQKGRLGTEASQNHKNMPGNCTVQHKCFSRNFRHIFFNGTCLDFYNNQVRYC